MHVADRLAAAIDRSASIACVGLDPRPDMLPPSIRKWAADVESDPREQIAAAFTRFNCAIIDAIAGHCAAVKPQAACYEAYGSPGWRALEATVSFAKKRGCQVILDAKRGDIGSTALHYREGLISGAKGLGGESIDGLGVDWLTVSPYLGRDSLLPMLDQSGGQWGLFVLVQTSNPGASDVQSMALDGGDVVATGVARLVAELARQRLGGTGFSDVGAVVGATWPDAARELRLALPNSVFLVPGYGAQGATASSAVAGRDRNGGGVLVSSSRGITAAWQTDDASNGFAEAARAALDVMNSDLDAART